MEILKGADNLNNYNIYMYMKSMISQGGDPLGPAPGYLVASRALRASPENVRPIPVLGCPTPRFPPYIVRTLHVHGAPAYG